MPQGTRVFTELKEVLLRVLFLTKSKSSSTGTKMGPSSEASVPST